MGMKEKSYGGAGTVSPLFLRNLIASIFISADKSFLFFAQKYKLLETFRYLIFTFSLFLLRFLPDFFLDSFSSSSSSSSVAAAAKVKSYHKQAAAFNRRQNEARPPQNDTGIARALSQLLSIANDIPVSSRKYEVVRSLAEGIIDENHRAGSQALREVNLAVMSAAFARTVSHLEAAVAERQREAEEDGIGGGAGGEFRLRKVLRAVRSVGWRGKGGGEGNRCGIPAEKLAAELLWLAQKMAACGFGGEAVWRWAAASNLGWLSVSVDPRLQGSLVRLSAFLFKEAKDMGLDETEGNKKELHMQVKIKMLRSWLPLLCLASNGTDAPALSISERTELERVLEEIIGGLEQEEQEQVLSLWLHHFTHCSSSDWPNLHACYARWCSASRKQLL